MKAQSEGVADRLKQALLARGLVQPEQIDRAARAQTANGGRIDLALTRLGLVAEREMAQVYAQVLGLSMADTLNYPQQPVWPGRLSAAFLRSARIVPIGVSDGRLRVAMADPLDAQAREALILAAGPDPVIEVGVPAEIGAALLRLYGAGETSPPLPSAPVRTEHASADILHLREYSSDAAAVKLVNQLVAGAISAKASDIHIEPFEGRLRVRYRIDGILADAGSPGFEHYPALIGRIKVLSQLDMAERRRPQDGRCFMQMEGRRVDLRVSILPTIYGEAAVLRVLDQEQAPLDLARLGFGTDQQDRIAALAAQPHGLMLICGPTGSGKTTTLYAAMRGLHDGKRKIVSAEDPVEYHIEGVSQIQVRADIGLGFSEILRAVLRHDPDVIMVGEARDSETAHIAVQAALTGHLVLCSLHTNDAAGAVTRLCDMGIEPYLLASTLRGVVAQRLVRKLCPHCRIQDSIDVKAGERLGLAPGARIWRPNGCAQCRKTGYAGRTVIAEFMPASETLQNLILASADSAGITRAMRVQGMRSLQADGLAKVCEGVTSLEEVLRVCAP